MSEEEIPIPPKITWRSIDGKWLLFYNQEYKSIPISNETKEKKKNPDAPFFYGPKKKESKGTVVHTPHGFGIVQEIKRESQEYVVKIHKSNKIITIKANEISSDIPLLITLYSGNSKTIESLVLPISSSSSDLISKIESSIFNNDDNILTIHLYHKGKEINNTENSTLDKLELFPFSKLLAVSQFGKPYQIERFVNVYEGWGYSDRSINAIAFSVNKDIKIRGFGIYTSDFSCEQRSFLTVIKFIKGTDNNGQLLHNKELTIGESNNGTKVFQYSFDRPVRIKAGEIYSCVQEAIGTYNCYTYYGDSGKVSVEGEKNIIFNFQDCFTSSNNTNKTCGQIPEIYYYV
jgi:hypothetical protein